MVLLSTLPGCSKAGVSSDLQHNPRDEGAAAGVQAANTGNYTIDDIYDSDDFAFDWQSGSYQTIHLSGATSWP